jgi:hypothetical protein
VWRNFSDGFYLHIGEPEEGGETELKFKYNDVKLGQLPTANCDAYAIARQKWIDTLDKRFSKLIEESGDLCLSGIDLHFDKLSWRREVTVSKPGFEETKVSIWFRDAHAAEYFAIVEDMTFAIDSDSLKPGKCPEDAQKSKEKKKLEVWMPQVDQSKVAYAVVNKKIVFKHEDYEEGVFSVSEGKFNFPSMELAATWRWTQSNPSISRIHKAPVDTFYLLEAIRMLKGPGDQQCLQNSAAEANERISLDTSKMVVVMRTGQVETQFAVEALVDRSRGGVVRFMSGNATVSVSIADGVINMIAFGDLIHPCSEGSR